MSARGIYGLSGSGMDIDSLVKVGMLSKQNEYDKMYKSLTKDQWKKEAYANTYSTLSTYRSSTLYDYRMSATFQPRNADSSDTTVATAVANANAAAMTHTIQVTSMATNAYLQSTSEIKNNNENASASIYLKDLINGTKAGKVKTTDSDGNVTEVDGFVSDPDKTVTGISETDYKAQLEAYAKADDQDAYQDLQNRVAISFTISSGDLYKEENDPVTGQTKKVYNGDNVNKATITITYKELFENNVTMNDLVSKINNATDARHKDSEEFNNGRLGINASYDATNKSFSLYQSQGGKENKLYISVPGIDNTSGAIKDSNADAVGSYKFVDSKADDAAAALLTRLNLAAVKTDASGNKTLDTTAINFTSALASSDNADYSLAGTDGEAIIDGKKYTTTSGKVSASNVTYTLKKLGTSTVSVSQDTDKIIENVKKFVEDYNKIIDDLNTKYSEKQYSDYQPLTESQEKAMTQDQITKWNEKAKSGLLYRDNTIGKIISNMRQALYTPVASASGTYNSMMSIGITSSNDKGHIKLDEEKLKKALAAEPNSVAEIMNSSGDVDAGLGDGSTKTEYSRQGITGRLNDVLTRGLKEMKTYAGTTSQAEDASSLGDLIMKLKEKMSTFKTQMTAFENALYSKYDAMETAIQKLSTTMGYITGGQ